MSSDTVFQMQLRELRHSLEYQLSAGWPLLATLTRIEAELPMMTTEERAAIAVDTAQNARAIVNCSMSHARGMLDALDHIERRAELHEQVGRAMDDWTNLFNGAAHVLLQVAAATAAATGTSRTEARGGATGGSGHPGTPAKGLSTADGPEIASQSMCAGCGGPFEPKPRKKYCSDDCRQAAYVARKAKQPNGQPTAPEPEPLPEAEAEQFRPGDGESWRAQGDDRGYCARLRQTGGRW